MGRVRVGVDNTFGPPPHYPHPRGGGEVYGAPRASPWSLKDAHVGRHPDHTMAHSSTAKAVVFCLSG